MKRILTVTAAAVVILLTSCDPQPQSVFYTDTIKAETGEKIFFYNRSYNASDYTWDFGDGTWTDVFEPVHSYNASGIFTVTLTVRSARGKTDRSSIEIEVLSPTMLEIEVLEYYEIYPVRGASVILYPTERDWNMETNAIAEGFTNAAGKVVFTGLQPQHYFVDVWHTYHNNYTLREEDVGFIMTDRLYKNQLNYFIAWVDYTGTKGISGRNRKQINVLKERSAATTTKPEAYPGTH